MINRNYHYELKAKPFDKSVHLKDFERYFNDIKDEFNSHKVRHPKEITIIKMDESEDNVIIIDLYTEDPLSKYRELQGARRVSELLAKYDKSIVVPKSHVLISA